jgi:hypothetical protein
VRGEGEKKSRRGGQEGGGGSEAGFDGAMGGGPEFLGQFEIANTISRPIRYWEYNLTTPLPRASKGDTGVG